MTETRVATAAEAARQLRLGGGRRPLEVEAPALGEPPDGGDELGLLIFLMYVPGGIVSAVYGARALIERIVRKARGLPPPPRVVPPLGELWTGAIGRRVPRATSEPARADPASNGRTTDGLVLDDLAFEEGPAQRGSRTQERRAEAPT